MNPFLMYAIAKKIKKSGRMRELEPDFNPTVMLMIFGVPTILGGTFIGLVNQADKQLEEQKKQAGIYRENLNNTKEKIKELEKEFVETVEKIQYRNQDKTSLFYRLGEIQEQVKIKMRSQK